MRHEALSREFKEIHRGRGVRRPRVRTWVGPLLLELVAADQRTPEEVVRARLIDLLRRATEELPYDLRILFLAAAGITDDQPFLEDRLNAAAELLDRGPRVLRRRLRTAEELIANRVVAGEVARHQQEPPWSWVRYEIDLDLRGRPRVGLELVARARAADVEALLVNFAAPPCPLDGEPAFTAINGCRVASISHAKPTLWDATLALPEPLGVGKTTGVTVQIDLPGREFLDPYLIMMPLRPMERIRTAVEFGPHASEAWLIRDAVPLTPALPAERIDLTRSTRVDVIHENPEAGLAYGVGWAWADA